MSHQTLKIALVQHRPVFQRLWESLQRLSHLAETARSQGARLLIFGETWLTGYPAWIDHHPGMARWGESFTRQAFADMLCNAWARDGKADLFLRKLCQKLDIYLFLGVNERVGNGTLYNALLLYGPNGRLQVHHRKLMPTYTEKLLYASGDGAGLISTDTPYGKIGGLICWEHWMPLARQTMHETGEHLHVALWPTVNELHQMASRHYAFEGRCYVVAAGQMLQVSDLPDYFPPLPDRQPEDWLLRGGSALIAPDGQYLLEPVYDREDILYHTMDDWSLLYQEQLTLDVTGHYARRDVFDLDVHRQRLDQR